MAKLELLHYPDPRLRTRAAPVAEVDERIRQLVDDMLETMYAASGLGLAATQVNVHLRVVVMDLSETQDAPLVLINPELTHAAGDEDSQEGCLSVPGYFETVRRSARIGIRALDREGAPFELEAEGLLAVCIQHEMDHLQGRLFVDYLSELKRRRLRRRMEKSARQESSAATPVA